MVAVWNTHKHWHRSATANAVTPIAVACGRSSSSNAMGGVAASRGLNIAAPAFDTQITQLTELDSSHA